MRGIAVGWIVFVHMFAPIFNGTGQLDWVRVIRIVVCPLKARKSMHIDLHGSKSSIHLAPFLYCRVLKWGVHHVHPQRVCCLGFNWVNIIIGNMDFTICANDNSKVWQSMIRRRENHFVECLKIVSWGAKLLAHFFDPLVVVGCQQQKLLLGLVERMRMCFNPEKAGNFFGDWMIHMVRHDNGNVSPRQMIGCRVELFHVKDTALETGSI